LKPGRRLGYLLRGLWAIVRTRFISHRPFLLSHLVTSRCNCSCPICLWRGYSDEELSTEEIVSIYEEAREEGFAALVLWGGEPLLRDDIDRIVRAAHEIGFVTLLITNGYRLPELADLICPYLNALIVSIDFPSERHDLFRGCPGLFGRAVAGIEKAKEVNPDMKLSINCVITRLNKDEVEGMIDLADRLGVSITFESMNTRMPFSSRDATPFKLSPEEESQVFELIRRYKLRGHRINNSIAYLETFIGGKKRFECHSLEVSLCLQSNGDVRICLSPRPLANLREVSIGEVLRMRELREYQRLGRRCHICNDYGTVECAHVWRFNPQALLGAAFAFLSR